MQIKFVSVMVADQEAALRFYGFTKMADIPTGGYRSLTVVPPDGIEGVELVREPMAFPPAKVFQKDVRGAYDRLTKRGVAFRGEPKAMGPITAAVFEDPCGNLINLVEPMARGRPATRRRTTQLLRRAARDSTRSRLWGS
jgi:catechol 2,3-dioxygenase-like lactoylglutathione lyase family enzyme